MDELKKLERRFRYLSKLFFPHWDNSAWRIEINPDIENAGECGGLTPDGYYRRVITIKQWLSSLDEMDAIILHEIIHAAVPEKASKLFKKRPDDDKVDGLLIPHGSMFHKEKNRVRRLAERMKRNKLALELDLDSYYSMKEGRKERKAHRRLIEEMIERDERR